MLRNQQTSKQLLKHLLPLTNQQQQRLVQQRNTVLYNKNTSIIRQGKIMGKLFGQRLSGSKKRWFPSTTGSVPAVDNTNVVFNQPQFGKISKGSKHNTRRMTVLNKLFMEHITDLMATGEISESILGKGLQVSRVKISQDFAFVNVFWLSSGEIEKDSLLELELQRCTGLLRHQLSQLFLMGEVPRIKFVREKLFTNIKQVETLLKTIELENEKNEQIQEQVDFYAKYKAERLKQEFYGGKEKDIEPEEKMNNESLKSVDTIVPEMRQDILGLDHKSIMFKILSKMRKSKQAWDQHKNKTGINSNSLELDNSTTIPSTSFDQLAENDEKLAKAVENSNRFQAFLANRKERRNTPERKRFRASDHHIGEEAVSDQYDELETMPVRQRHLFEAEDYLLDEMEDKTLK